MSRPDSEHDDYVDIKVAAVALGVKPRQAYNLAKADRWRTAPGEYPAKYSLDDIRTTHRNRKDTPS